MPEADQPGPVPEEIETHRQQPEGQELGHQTDLVVAGDERKGDEEGEDEDVWNDRPHALQGAARRHRDARRHIARGIEGTHRNSPPGRKRRMITANTSTAALAIVGFRKYPVSVPPPPMMTPPPTSPSSDPTPPTTTTIKARAR